ncbi:BtrH N-terminal domain-containing protein [Nonomuraea sp. NPDC050790]|uniref:BtrH N-terminal domain-containing protein n=1 Tax=Nonomuraea sp. NPDC050790 TaxID=3364371 RepID=UPI0037B9F1E3
MTHYESALLRRVLGEELPESMWFGLGGGIGFMYFVFEYTGEPPHLSIIAQAHPEPMFVRALERAGVPHEVRRTGSAKVAERNLRAALDAGRRVVCRVDRHRLPWRPDFPFPEPIDVDVLGVSGDRVRLGDGEMPLEAFLDAWSAAKKERHQLVEITGTGGGRPDVAGAIKETSARLTGPVLGNNFDVNFGLSGMRKLAEQLGDTSTKQGWTRRFPDAEVALDRLAVCLDVDYTAPAASRPLFAEFLAEVGEDAASRIYRASGEIWADVVSAARARESYPRIGELVGAAVQEEERGVAAIS